MDGAPFNGGIGAGTAGMSWFIRWRQGYRAFKTLADRNGSSGTEHFPI